MTSTHRPASPAVHRAQRALYGAGVALALCFGLAGCATNELVPLAANERGVSVVERAGLEIRAEIGGSRARTHLPRSVTPVKLSVRNLSPEGVFLSLDDIRLVGEQGVTLTAIDPLDITPRPPVQSLGVDPASPFAVSGAPSSSLPSLPSRSQGDQGVIGSPSGPVVDNPGFGPTQGRPNPPSERWKADRDLARDEIRSQAFEGGFIDSGEAQQGYVYFRDPPEDVERLNLEVRLHSGEASGPGVVVEIPYSVRG